MNLLRIKRSLLAIILAGLASLCSAQIYHPTPLAGKTLTQDFIHQNQHYPEQELKDGKNGKVVVTFAVDEKGQCSDYRVSESFCDEADRDALDLVKKILWAPATKDMKPIADIVEYEVEYSAKAYRRYWKKRERTVLPLTLDADTSYHIYDIHALEEAAKPYFADGSSMAQYIMTNLEYPESAKAAEVSGTVRLSFVVETDGAVSNITIVQSVGAGCDNEAVRLLQETRWIPAVKNGKYVRSHNLQDITFNIGARNYFDGNGY